MASPFPARGACRGLAAAVLPWPGGASLKDRMDPNQVFARDRVLLVMTAGDGASDSCTGRCWEFCPGLSLVGGTCTTQKDLVASTSVIRGMTMFRAGCHAFPPSGKLLPQPYEWSGSVPSHVFLVFPTTGPPRWWRRNKTRCSGPHAADYPHHPPLWLQVPQRYPSVPAHPRIVVFTRGPSTAKPCHQ